MSRDQSCALIDAAVAAITANAEELTGSTRRSATATTAAT